MNILVVPMQRSMRSGTQKWNVRGSILFVTLEPCSHHGKTPPCADLILENKIQKVIIGVLDPNPMVNGKGKKYLQDHGLDVEVGFMEEEILRMNEPFSNLSIRQTFLYLENSNDTGW